MTINAASARKLLRAWHRDRCRLEGASPRLSLVQDRDDDGEPWGAWDGHDEPWGPWVRTYQAGRWAHVALYRRGFPDPHYSELIDTIAVRVTPYGTIEES
jgi:hypothetical protein